MATLYQRAKLAIQVFRQGGIPTSRQSGSKMLVGWPSWQNGQPEWQMVDLKAYVNEGFNHNSLIYSAIRYKFNSLTSAPLRAYTGDELKPEIAPPQNPLALLLKHVNRFQTRIQFAQLQIVYLNVAGNSYTWLERPKGYVGDPTALPVALWNLRPDRVFIVPDGERGIKGFKYVPEGKTERDGIPILPEDMMHMKLPNPGDTLEGLGYGLSPMMPMARDGDLDNYITYFLNKLFQKGTMLGGLLKFNVPMDDTTVAEARRRWQERYGGVDNWGDVAVLDQGGDYKSILPSFKELDFQSIDARDESRILGPFGVPGMLVGARSAMQTSAFANFEQADRTFWQNTFVPELMLFDEGYQQRLTYQDAWPRHDVSGVPALQKNVPALVDAAWKMWSMGTPRHSAYKTVGLSVEEQPDGNVGYVPLNMLPVGTPKPPPAPNPAKELPAPELFPALPDGQKDSLPQPPPPQQAAQKGWTPEQKAAIWKALDTLAASHEKPFQAAAYKQFEADKRAILVLVNEVEKKALHRKATINWMGLTPEIVKYLLKSAPDGWKNTFVPVMSALVEETGNYWSAQLGFSFDVRNLLGEAWFQDYTLKFSQPINQTSLDSIHAVLAQAQKEGWSVPTMQKNMTTLFQQWMDGDLSADDFEWFSQRMPPNRTELIARTETTRINAAGTQALGESWGVKKKQWLATEDGRTRDSHASADGQEVDMTETFSVGGYKMMHPGDTSLGAPVSEIANCRCAEALLPNE
jgi:HK97 family phage portal protein